MDLKYTEILRRNAELGDQLTDRRYDVVVLSNVTVSQLKEVVEYTLRVDGVPAEVTIGEYDNIVQDSLKHGSADLVLLFWEAYNLVEGLHGRIESMDPAEVDALFDKVAAEIDFVLGNLNGASLVLMNSFTGLLFSGLKIGGTALDALAARLNRHVESRLTPNVKLVDLARVIAQNGVTASLDQRYLHSSKAPYTLDFFRNYAKAIKPFVMSARGKAKKALILDCDNTLWKGVLGEDGFDGVQMSATTKDGAAFAEVQSLALALNRQGVLLGLCSKNNPEDVDQVLRSHPDMQIREAHVAVKRVNWQDKATNLRSIASELNIGLDSLVFVDDSSFEVELIREQLPEVTVVQVPGSAHLYPSTLRAHMDLFYSLSSTAEDRRKSAMYGEQAQRQAEQGRYADLDDYLASLGTKLIVHLDDPAITPRMAQLTQKTNQFNLTTRRYTEADIANMVAGAGMHAIAFSVQDKFGDSGVTGLCLVTVAADRSAEIDTLLMSCRVLGRKVEFAFMNWLVEHLKVRGVKRLHGRYLRTPKNAQVADFLDRCSFSPLGGDESDRSYRLDIQTYRATPVPHVEIIDGRPH